MSTRKKKPQVFIYGAGGHAKVVADIIFKQNEYDLVGFIDDDPKKKGAQRLGKPVLGGTEILPTLLKQKIRFAIVGIADNKIRVDCVRRLEKQGFQFITAIHPRACISTSTTFGKGTVVMGGAIINADAEVGQHCVINTAAVVEHDNLIGSFVHIAPLAGLAGGVKVGDHAFVGLGALVKQNCVIGEASVVGAGAVVVNNISANTTVVGVPARLLNT
jgi:sugar O-acyltransferase (sialic acid O-acetyltransferase NeuD family)